MSSVGFTNGLRALKTHPRSGAAWGSTDLSLHAGTGLRRGCSQASTCAQVIVPVPIRRIQRGRSSGSGLRRDVGDVCPGKDSPSVPGTSRVCLMVAFPILPLRSETRNVKWHLDGLGPDPAVGSCLCRDKMGNGALT